jgi:carboxylesterase type B
MSASGVCVHTGHNICAQPQNGAVNIQFIATAMNESCLTLNIFTPTVRHDVRKRAH